LLPAYGMKERIDRMKQVPKETTDDALIQEFLNKPMPSELGLSNNVWNNKMTKEEKAARDKPKK
jgi:hypothetical protein